MLNDIIFACEDEPTNDYEESYKTWQENIGVIDNGRVDYCEQSLDDMHIFRFEFWDDEFKDLQYFSIDG